MGADRLPWLLGCPFVTFLSFCLSGMCIQLLCSCLGCLPGCDCDSRANLNPSGVEWHGGAGGGSKAISLEGTQSSTIIAVLLSFYSSKAKQMFRFVSIPLGRTAIGTFRCTFFHGLKKIHLSLKFTFHSLLIVFCRKDTNHEDPPLAHPISLPN